MFDLFPRLQEREHQKAGTMSGGEQQMLAIGRALMARPKLLLLDEPSMGIAPILVQRIYETIAEINRAGVAILLVEQNANYALDVVAARLRARDRPGRARRDDSDDCSATDPEVQRAVPGDLSDDRLRPDRREGALPAVRVAAVGGGRRLGGRAQGLRRARRAHVRPAAVGRRTPDRAAVLPGRPGSAWKREGPIPRRRTR